MIENLPDDVLLEILTRVGDCESIIRCTSVSKRWFSLITGNSKLDHRFTLHRRHQICNKLMGFGARDAYHYCELTAASGNPLPETSLDFLPWERRDLRIRATAGDLWLVSGAHRDLNGSNDRDFCVCNPLTKQTVILPRSPPNKATRWALALRSKSCDARVRCNCNLRYKAVMIEHSREFLYVTMFCSETGRWAQTGVRAPPWGPNGRVVTLNDDVLHWLTPHGVVATYSPFEPMGDRLRYLPMPREYRRSATEHLLLGSVRGRLRLCQTIWDFPRVRQVLRVWERKESSEESRWELAHDAEVDVRGVAALVLVFALDAVDGDKVVVVGRLREDVVVYEYDIGERRFERVGRLPEMDEYSKSMMARFLYYPLRRHPIPTVVPPLPTPTILAPTRTLQVLASCLGKICSTTLFY